MSLYKNKYRVESARLQDYNYASPGAYFVTVVTHNRECLFGNLVDGKVVLNGMGKIVEECWYDLPNHYSYITLDQFIVMPNHIHGIVIINNAAVETGHIVETGLRPVSTTTTTTTTTTTKNHGLSEIVRALKSFSARKINKLRKTKNLLVWQSRFYDHIVRDEKSLNNIREYIMNNPLNWETDNENPFCVETVETGLRPVSTISTTTKTTTTIRKQEKR